MKRTTMVLIVMLLTANSGTMADVIKPQPGKQLKGSRGMAVEGNIQNDHQAFSVRVAVDHANRVYREGDVMRVAVKSSQAGYLYLLYRQADESTVCLFPNLYESDNRISANTVITIPTPKQGFRMRCKPPFGDELLVAVVTARPIAVEKLGVTSLTRSVTTSVKLNQFVNGIRKGFESEGTGSGLDQWAEHSVQIKTVAASSTTTGQSQAHKRIGLFVGISDYQDDSIRDLHLCDRDAKVMAEAMQRFGNLDGVGVLTNEQATRHNVEKAFQELKEKSQPNDEIFVYWSGHGGTCADTSGEEADGLDEFLVPYDARLNDVPGSMILDDTLGRWVQSLDGRKVTLIIDACHAAGQATGKGISDRSTSGSGNGGIIQSADKSTSSEIGKIFNDVKNDRPRGTDGRKGTIWDGTQPVPSDLLDNELSRVKDIGQDDATVLFSSASDQVSAERRDGKLSVMTYFLVKKLVESDHLTLLGAYGWRVENVGLC